FRTSLYFRLRHRTGRRSGSCGPKSSVIRRYVLLRILRIGIIQVKERTAFFASAVGDRRVSSRADEIRVASRWQKKAPTPKGAGAEGDGLEVRVVTDHRQRILPGVRVTRLGLCLPCPEHVVDVQIVARPLEQFSRSPVLGLVPL